MAKKKRRQRKEYSIHTYLEKDGNHVLKERQAVVRTLQSSLRAVGGSRQDAERLLGVATQLSRDVVEDIRCDLVDQVPHLAMVCNMSVDERGDSFGDLVAKHLLPIVLVLLKDPNKLIHKTAQGALLALLEQGFLPPEVVEEKLVPLVVSWTMLNDVEFNTASVGLACYSVSLAPITASFDEQKLTANATMVNLVNSDNQEWTALSHQNGCEMVFSLTYHSHFDELMAVACIRTSNTAARQTRRVFVPTVKLAVLCCHAFHITAIFDELGWKPIFLSPLKHYQEI
ncbi:hypothetical protein B566_EDAN006935 [Ephemera danica]|nr:hypothetical protein B566_EDAN006935 [Ephemera danica]